MRFQKALLIAVLLAVAVIALGDLQGVGRLGTFVLPFMGAYILPTRLLGLFGLVLVALAFYFSAGYMLTQASARRVEDLERIEALRATINLCDSGQFSIVRASLDNHANAIMARLETLRPREIGSSEPPNGLLDDHVFEAQELDQADAPRLNMVGLNPSIPR